MIFFPNGKINLGLHIVGKREDGFHEIETCFYPVKGLRDAVEMVKAKDLRGGAVEFSCSGLAVDCEVGENLCVKAYELLRTDFPERMNPGREGGEGVKLHLHKAIPFGAGLGGGSADATAVLRMTNELYQLGLSMEELERYAGRLGSDTVFFLHNEPMLGWGRGEELTSLKGVVDLSGWWILMVKPDVGVSTAAAYAAVTPHKPPCELPAVLRLPVEEWCGKLVNDFEEPIVRKLPVLEEIKQSLYRRGATYASMSGSGSTVFGLFRDEPTGIQSGWGGCFVHSEQL